MKTRRVALTTCGTSLLTNGADEDTRAWLNRSTNSVELPPDDEARLRALVEEKARKLAAGDEETRRRMSAELNGLGALQDTQPADETLHVLLHTDTVTGRAACDAIAEVLTQGGASVEKLTAGGLRTDDLSGFRSALADLMVDLESWSGYREAGWEVVYNLTGGFKSVNAYLQAAGAFYADRCVFLFEGSSQLMEIPRLPVSLDEAAVVRAHLDVFRRWAADYTVSSEDVRALPETLLLESDGQAVPSVWGDLIWSRCRREVLSEKLHEPLSDRLEVSEKVKKAFESLDPDQRVHVNETLAHIARHLDTGEPPPDRSKLKQLRGNPTPPSTHEVYLWSDGAAWRIFGRYFDRRFQADSLGPHLR